MKRSASRVRKHRVGKLAQLSGRPHRLAGDQQRRRDFDVAARGGAIEKERRERARQARARVRVSTAKRLPESFAARAKSRMPSRSPSSQCGFGAKSKSARLAPARARRRFALRRRRRERNRRASSADCRAARATANRSSVGESARARSSDCRDASARAPSICGSQLARGGRFVWRLARSRPRADFSRLSLARRPSARSGTLRRSAEARRRATDRARGERESRRTRSGSRRMRAMSSMEKRAIMQSANPVLPARAFAAETLLPPRQAIVAYFARVTIAPPRIERVALDDALGRVLAEPIAADDDYPNAPRSADGRLRRLRAQQRPALSNRRRRAHGRGAATRSSSAASRRANPDRRRAADGRGRRRADRRRARRRRRRVVVEARLKPARTSRSAAPTCGAARSVLAAGRRIRAPRGRRARNARRHRGPGLSPSGRRGAFERRRARRARARRPQPGRGARFESLRDRRVAARDGRARRGTIQRCATKPTSSKRRLRSALAECDAVVVSGGSSVGERDRLPRRRRGDRATRASSFTACA